MERGGDLTSVRLPFSRVYTYNAHKQSRFKYFSSSSSESCDAAKKLGRRRSSTPLISSPSSSSPSSSSSGDTLGPAGSHHRSASGPSPSTAETPASPCLRIPTLSNGETPLIPDVDSAPLSGDDGSVGPTEAGQPPPGGEDKCYSSNHRHRKRETSMKNQLKN